MIRLSIIILIVLLMMPGLSLAILLVDKPTDVSPISTGYTSMYGDQNMIEHFTLSDTATISQVSWTGLFSSGLISTPQSVASFDVLLFANDAASSDTTANGGLVVSGLPAYQPFYTATFSDIAGVSTGLSNPIFGGTVYQWTVNLPGLSLHPDQYWIDIRSSSTEHDYFIWSNTLTSDGYTVYSGNPETLTLCTPSPDPHNHCNPTNLAGWSVVDEVRGQAFSITGVNVPEPSALGLLAVSLGGLLLLRRQFVRRDRRGEPMLPS